MRLDFRAFCEVPDEIRWRYSMRVSQLYGCGQAQWAQSWLPSQDVEYGIVCGVIKLVHHELTRAKGPPNVSGCTLVVREVTGHQWVMYSATSRSF